MGRIYPTAPVVHKTVSKKGRAREWHGLSRTPEYGIWYRMKWRCLDSSCKRYKDYGGRGITVCARWINSFSDFLADVGKRPSPKHSLDRQDNEGNYEPGNVRWATHIQQVRNARSNIRITIDGTTRCLSEWCEHLGAPYMLSLCRIRSGWDPLEAMTTPQYGKRTGYHRGEQVKSSKLTEQNVREIRQLLEEGSVAEKIAPLFGVSGTVIRGIKKGTIWKHVK